MNRNTLWEKHRLYLPAMRQIATHRCKHCCFFVVIQGKAETKRGCVANIKVYKQREKPVPRVISVWEIIKQVGLEGLERTLKNSDPEAQSCGMFQLPLGK